MIQCSQSLLGTINNPRDLDALSSFELSILAQEIRERLLEVINKTGGHLASNLGVVELTIALHRVFHSPEDKIVFDVSHQSYVHKLLTGRNDEKFNIIRQSGGYSGFCSINESVHDVFTAGHAGTALSSGLGIAIARDKLEKKFNVVVILGDAGLTCGPTMEALNNVAANTRRLIVVLNDNEYSIERNIGALAIYLNKIIKSKLYERVLYKLSALLNKGKIGKRICHLGRRLKFALKDFLLSSSFFERYGLRYIGPIDGHNIEQLEEYLNLCKSVNYPILLHVKTIKGKGNHQAVLAPDKFHNLSPNQQNKKILMRDVLGKTVLELAQSDERIITVTAAMGKGTGLSFIRDNLPDRYLDVGIAEEHAVTMCAGLAKVGMRPICAIYSTFMQRAFDQILHDICLQNLPVIFCLDRAGLTPNDGATHHGLFDIVYTRCLPNAIVMQPRHTSELSCMLRHFIYCDKPVFIRYNSSYYYDNESVETKDLELGKAEILKEEGNICLLALGCFVDIAEQVDNFLNGACCIVNARFIKPLDENLLTKLASQCKLLVTLEDGVLSGGFGSAILEFFNEHKITTPVLRFGWPDHFIEHGSSAEVIRKKYYLDAASIAKKISNFI